MNSDQCMMVIAEYDSAIEANARLIAAAPELLEALRECEAFLQRDYLAGNKAAQAALRRALAAIAAVEGK